MQAALEVAIGVVLTIAVLAVVVSSTMELISGLIRLRAHSLEEGLARMLDDGFMQPTKWLGWLGRRKPHANTDATQVVLRHPLVKSLSSGRATDKPPSYIDAVTFATALLGSSLNGVNVTKAHTTDGAGGVTKGITEISHAFPTLGSSLDALWQRAEHDFTRFRHEIEDWFDREMQRVSGWYSRRSQWIMLIVALVVTVVLNISAVTVAKSLWFDPTLRAKAVAAAENVASTSTTTPATSAVANAPGATTATTPTTTATTTPPAGTQSIDQIGLPIGWSKTAWPGWTGYLALHLFGILVAAIAASFGAPFWFDLLNRLVNLRVGGCPPATAAEQRAASTPTQRDRPDVSTRS